MTDAQLALERATGCPVKHLESVPVVETFRGETVWKGIVEVFTVTQPPPKLAYAWPIEGQTEREFVTVLGDAPVDSPIAAVRAWLASEAKKGKPL